MGRSSLLPRHQYGTLRPFHRDLEDALQKAGLLLNAINAFQVRCFAPFGRRAKINAVDPRMLAMIAGVIEDLPAVVTVQHNPDLRRKYEALVGKGKPPKIALTTVMRKLLVLANALVQQDRLLDSGRIVLPVILSGGRGDETATDTCGGARQGP